MKKISLDDALKMQDNFEKVHVAIDRIAGEVYKEIDLLIQESFKLFNTVDMETFDEFLGKQIEAIHNKYMRQLLEVVEIDPDKKDWTDMQKKMFVDSYVARSLQLASQMSLTRLSNVYENPAYQLLQLLKGLGR